MKLLLYLFALVCVLQGAHSYAFHRNIFADTVCKQAGPTCKNCQELINCIEIEKGKFLEVSVKKCATQQKEFCLRNQCSTAPNPQCTGSGAKDFTCHNTGVYPDPSDCRTYHMCVENIHKLKPDASPPGQQPKPTHIALKCDENYGYDPVTTYCKDKLTNNLCTSSSVPTCKNLGDTGAIEGTSIFYVCMEETSIFVPHLYMCPAGTQFQQDKCVDESATETTDSGTTPTTTTSNYFD